MPQTHFPELRQMIRDEEDRRGLSAVSARISKRAANEFLGMGAKEWREESGGEKSIEECRAFVADFDEKGEVAANGLKISPVGPTVVVSEDPKAPLVEILNGIPTS
jgi:hypothetical protein